MPKVESRVDRGPILIGSRVEEIAQKKLLSSGDDSQAPEPQMTSEVKSRFHEMSSPPKTEGSRKAELEKMYDKEIKDQPKIPGTLSAKTPTKEEWVEMRLGLEKKLSGGLLNRLKRAAKIIGKGLPAIQEKGFKGALLAESFRMEAVLPQHPMGERFASLSKEWQAAEGTLSFRNWLRENHPEVLAVERVAYFTEEERRLTTLGLNGDGVLMNGDVPYSTATEKVANGVNQATHQVNYRAGVAMYVVGPDQAFHATSQILFEKHHSSILAGGAVIGAGECKVENGRLTMISNKSGHYKPSKENMLDVLRILHDQLGEDETVKLFDVLPEFSPEAEEARTQALTELFERGLEQGVGSDANVANDFNKPSVFSEDFEEDLDLIDQGYNGKPEDVEE